MGRITLAGAIPGDNNNGLGVASELMIDDYTPGDDPVLYNVLVRVSVRKIVTDTEHGGTQYPVLRIQHWEMVPEEHQAAFGKMIGDAFGVRTGLQELPFPDGTVPVKAEDPFPEEDSPAGELAGHQARGRQ